jgi:hypothetical protein
VGDETDENQEEKKRIPEKTEKDTNRRSAISKDAPKALFVNG